VGFTCEIRGEKRVAGRKAPAATLFRATSYTTLTGWGTIGTL
jgi:hypothetical protein